MLGIEERGRVVVVSMFDSDCESLPDASIVVSFGIGVKYALRFFPIFADFQHETASACNLLGHAQRWLGLPGYDCV